MQNPQPVTEFLGSTRLAPVQMCGWLSLTPIVLAPGSTPLPFGYIPLAEGLRNGTVTVNEVSDSGSVPHVRVCNLGADAVLFLFGEEISGAKQNRVANASFMIGPHSEVVLDVSCVEAGRWHRDRDRGFDASEPVISQALRRKMERRVAASRAEGAGFRASQGEVWSEIDNRITSSGARSATNSYGDYRRSRTAELDEFESTFVCVEHQVGFVATIAGRIHGVEIIGQPAVFRSSFRSLLRAYSVDAIDAAWMESEAARAPGTESVEAFLEAVAAAGLERTQSLGLGEDLRLTGRGVEGCALVAEGLIHLAAFPAAGPPAGGAGKRRQSNSGTEQGGSAWGKAA